MLTVPSSVQTAVISALLALINTKLDKINTYRNYMALICVHHADGLRRVLNTWNKAFPGDFALRFDMRRSFIKEKKRKPKRLKVQALSDVIEVPF